MSGVEVAGLVLGAFPLLLAALQFYSEGIDVTKRCLRYRQEVNILLADLKTENALYRNNVAILLQGVVDAKDMDKFSADPGGELWKAPGFDRKLKQRLGNSYEPYLHTIGKLQAAIKSFGEKLKLGKSGHVGGPLFIAKISLLTFRGLNSHTRKPSQSSTSVSSSASAKQIMPI